MKVLRNMSLESFCMGEKVYSETKKNRQKKIAFCNTTLSSFAKLQEHTP